MLIKKDVYGNTPIFSTCTRSLFVGNITVMMPKLEFIFRQHTKYRFTQCCFLFI